MKNNFFCSGQKINTFLEIDRKTTKINPGRYTKGLFDLADKIGFADMNTYEKSNLL